MKIPKMIFCLVDLSTSSELIRDLILEAVSPNNVFLKVLKRYLYHFYLLFA
jgi:hypothetical protein